MKKICFGSIFTLLTFTKTKINQNDLYSKILDSALQSRNDDEGNGIYVDNNPGNVSRYKTGTSLVDAVVDACRHIDIKEYTKKINEQVIPYINPKMYKKLVLAFKDMLYCSDIVDNTLIGASYGYTKNVIIRSSIFSFSELLSNILVFAIIEQENDCTGLFDEVTREYLNNFTNEDEIQFDDNPSRVDFELSFTAKNADFSRTFKEIKIEKQLPLANHNLVKAYHLLVSSNKFDFLEIEKYIKKNIYNYVFSRAKVDKYLDEQDFSIGLDAANYFKAKYGTDEYSKHFNDVMLYAFLECGLNAPKVFSKIELDNMGGVYKSQTSGIHYFNSNIPGVNNKIVLGISNEFDNINSAIDKAFESIISIKPDKEFNLIDENLLWTSFSKDATTYLKNEIVPSRKNKYQRPDTAFGVFVCYKIEISDIESLNNSSFRIELDKKIADDISSSMDYIYKKISDLHLMGNSFYFYFLPLLEPKDNKQEIMKEALEGTI